VLSAVVIILSPFSHENELSVGGVKTTASNATSLKVWEKLLPSVVADIMLLR
jgi:hypothetical protein